MSWQESTLGAECELYQPKTLAKNELNESGLYKVYGANGVIGTHSEFNHEDSQLLVTCRGATCGTINISEPMSWINGNAMVVKPRKGNLDLMFLRHYLHHLDISKAITGAAQPQITRQSLAPIEIKFPPLEEQKRIAQILDKAAEIKAKRELAIAKLDELATNIFEETISHSSTSEALGALCDVRDGTHDSPKYTTEGYPLITSKNIVHGKIDKSTVNLVSEEDYNEICKRSKVSYGDILMPMIGTIGNPVIVEELEPKFAIKNVALIKFHKNSPQNTYINAFLKSKQFHQYVSSVSRGGTQKFLGLGDIRKLEIPQISQELADKFCQQMQVIRWLREKAIKQSIEINRLTASLQHQAFTTGFSA